MSGADRHSEAPQDPPWSPELLADFHAELLDQETQDAVHAQVRTDSQAREVLSALETTSAELRTLPSPAIPDDVTERIEAALQEAAASRQRPVERERAERERAERERAEPGPAKTGLGRRITGKGGHSRINSRTGRDRGLGWTVGPVAVAAAMVGAVIVVASPGNGPTDEQPLAAEPHSAATSGSTPAQPAPLALRGNNLALSGEQFAEVLGSEQYTGLSAPKQLIGCLRANGVDDGGKPLGARAVTLNGKSAQLLILSTGRIGEFRLLAVGPDCGPGRSATIADTTFGG
ncbi:hypothetical protein [Haloactinomyces albus]|uniref:Anti-sigma-M factor RsmA n=1 Tax=Haloactinomyces albus TaxID=1352928 RepID=A0AAE3ZBS7_9ACTN|nr:hypothetical protein [Haloactinomyces albus]MDR7302028.1 hypothetical protein [Haloactinomyces albus]